MTSLRIPSTLAALLLALALPIDLHSSRGIPTRFDAGDISELEVDVTLGFLYFKVGKEKLWWHADGSRAERIRTALLVGSQLERCKSIEVIWNRDRPHNRDGVIYDFASSLVIELHPPAE